MSNELIYHLASEAQLAYRPADRPTELNCSYREGDIAPQLARFAALVANECIRQASIVQGKCYNAGSLQQACGIVNAIVAIEAAFPMPKD